MGPSILSGIAGLLLFGIAVLVAGRLLGVRQPQSGDDTMYVVFSVVGWVLIVMAFVGLTVLLLGGLAVPFWLASAIIAGMAFQRRRRARQYAVLSVMAVAAERLMPLVPAIEAVAAEQGGLLAYRLHGLASLLSAGAPLPVALAEYGGVIPPEAVATIRAGYESGMLAPALRRAVETRNLHQPLWDSLSGKVLYLCGLFCFALLVMFWMMLRIAPAMQKIFDDFEVELPAATQLLLTVSHLMTSFGLLLVLPVVMAAVALFFYVALHYCGVVGWGVPGLGWLLKRRDTANILEALALVARRGRPLVQGIASLADAYPRRAIRRRLEWVLHEVSGGGDWCTSLHARGLIGAAEVAVLQAAERLGNLPWALEEMADSSRRRLLYRLQALLQVLFPLVLLSMGALVMLVVVGYFMPLVKLIESLSPAGW